MSANQEAKKVAVEEIKKLIDSSKSIVLVDYRGITVSQDTALRKEMRNNNVVYKVIKNTLFKKACEQLGIAGFDEALNGTTAFAFGLDDETVAPRLVKNAMKDLYKDYSYKNVSPEILIASFIKSTHYDLEGFFNSWLNGKVVVK